MYRLKWDQETKCVKIVKVVGPVTGDEKLYKNYWEAWAGKLRAEARLRELGIM